MNNIQKAAVLYVLLMAIAIYGYSVGRLQAFHYSFIEPLVEDFQALAEGNPTDAVSIVEKLKSDFGFSFGRMLYAYPGVASCHTKLQGFPTLATRVEPPLVFVHPQHRQEYRVISGALNLDNTFWGGLLIGTGSRILHSWDLSTDHPPTNEAKPHLKNLYGVHLFPDGSVIFSMHESGCGIVKVDPCRKVVWNREGHYHDAISPDEHCNFWIFEGGQQTFDQDVIKVPVNRGKIVQRIRMEYVRKANPDIAIWHLQRKVFELFVNDEFYELGNMTHGNDIDTLLSRPESNFSDFALNDILISYATTDLIFVLGPETLKVKWWRVGVRDAQRDHDWEPSGEISIYSNNARDKANSDNVPVDPEKMDFDVTVPGDMYHMRSKINSPHELSPYGTRMIGNGQQGWALVVNEEQKVVYNFNQEKRRAMHLADA